ncbi:MAG TPA: hypothetical protein VFX65_00400 [Candidatus Limnocylindrales bacterium]|nr:hypothetical protein [Candidatus Limnocylindrales bacterium]
MPGVPALVMVLALSACTGAAGTASAPASPTVDPGASPAASPDTGSIDHATGATDVVFRFEEGGGLVPMGFFATEAPVFTLYGDGRVIFDDVAAPMPPDADGIGRIRPYWTVTLSEEEIQAFLSAAISDGGLGVAKETFPPIGADMPTSIFTINAGGASKTVSVTGLGADRGNEPDAPVLRALARLADRIRGFATEVTDEAVWVPDRWRGVLTPDTLLPPRAWPWPGIEPADFVQPEDPNGPRFPIRTMTSAEVAALGLTDIDGGFSSLALTAPDGKAYLFALRPLFPDENR